LLGRRLLGRPGAGRAGLALPPESLGGLGEAVADRAAATDEAMATNAAREVLIEALSSALDERGIASSFDPAQRERAVQPHLHMLARAFTNPASSVKDTARLVDRATEQALGWLIGELIAELERPLADAPPHPDRDRTRGLPAVAEMLEEAPRRGTQLGVVPSYVAEDGLLGRGQLLTVDVVPGQPRPLWIGADQRDEHRRVALLVKSLVQKAVSGEQFRHGIHFEGMDARFGEGVVDRLVADVGRAVDLLFAGTLDAPTSRMVVLRRLLRLLFDDGVSVSVEGRLVTFRLSITDARPSDKRHELERLLGVDSTTAPTDQLAGGASAAARHTLPLPFEADFVIPLRSEELTGTVTSARALGGAVPLRVGDFAVTVKSAGQQSIAADMLTWAARWVSGELSDVKLFDVKVAVGVRYDLVQNSGRSRGGRRKCRASSRAHLGEFTAVLPTRLPERRPGSMREVLLRAPAAAQLSAGEPAERLALSAPDVLGDLLYSIEGSADADRLADMVLSLLPDDVRLENPDLRQRILSELGHSRWRRTGLAPGKLSISVSVPRVPGVKVGRARKPLVISFSYELVAVERFESSRGVTLQGQTIAAEFDFQDDMTGREQTISADGTLNVLSIVGLPLKLLLLLLGVSYGRSWQKGGQHAHRAQQADSSPTAQTTALYRLSLLARVGVASDDSLVTGGHDSSGSVKISSWLRLADDDRLRFEKRLRETGAGSPAPLPGPSQPMSGAARSNRTLAPGTKVPLDPHLAEGAVTVWHAEKVAELAEAAIRCVPYHGDYETLAREIARVWNYLTPLDLAAVLEEAATEQGWSLAIDGADGRRYRLIVRAERTSEPVVDKELDDAETARIREARELARLNRVYGSSLSGSIGGQVRPLNLNGWKAGLFGTGQYSYGRSKARTDQVGGGGSLRPGVHYRGSVVVLRSGWQVRVSLHAVDVGAKLPAAGSSAVLYASPEPAQVVLVQHLEKDLLLWYLTRRRHYPPKVLAVPEPASLRPPPTSGGSAGPGTALARREAPHWSRIAPAELGVPQLTVDELNKAVLVETWKALDRAEQSILLGRATAASPLTRLLKRAKRWVTHNLLGSGAGQVAAGDDPVDTSADRPLFRVEVRPLARRDLASVLTEIIGVDDRRFRSMPWPAATISYRDHSVNILVNISAELIPAAEQQAAGAPRPTLLGEYRKEPEMNAYAFTSELRTHTTSHEVRVKGGATLGTPERDIATLAGEMSGKSSATRGKQDDVISKQVSRVEGGAQPTLDVGNLLFTLQSFTTIRGPGNGAASLTQQLGDPRRLHVQHGIDYLHFPKPELEPVEDAEQLWLPFDSSNAWRLLARIDPHGEMAFWDQLSARIMQQLQTHTKASEAQLRQLFLYLLPALSRGAALDKGLELLINGEEFRAADAQTGSYPTVVVRATPVERAEVGRKTNPRQGHLNRMSSRDWENSGTASTYQRSAGVTFNASKGAGGATLNAVGAETHGAAQLSSDVSASRWAGYDEPNRDELAVDVVFQVYAELVWDAMTKTTARAGTTSAAGLLAAPLAGGTAKKPVQLPSGGMVFNLGELSVPLILPREVFMTGGQAHEPDRPTLLPRITSTQLLDRSHTQLGPPRTEQKSLDDLVLDNVTLGRLVGLEPLRQLISRLLHQAGAPAAALARDSFGRAWIDTLTGQQVLKGLENELLRKPGLLFRVVLDSDRTWRLDIGRIVGSDKGVVTVALPPSVQEFEIELWFRPELDSARPLTAAAWHKIKQASEHQDLPLEWRKTTVERDLTASAEADPPPDVNHSGNVTAKWSASAQHGTGLMTGDYRVYAAGVAFTALRVPYVAGGTFTARVQRRRAWPKNGRIRQGKLVVPQGVLFHVPATAVESLGLPAPVPAEQETTFWTEYHSATERLSDLADHLEKKVGGPIPALERLRKAGPRPPSKKVVPSDVDALRFWLQQIDAYVTDLLPWWESEVELSPELTASLLQLVGPVAARSLAATPEALGRLVKAAYETRHRDPKADKVARMADGGLLLVRVEHASEVADEAHQLDLLVRYIPPLEQRTGRRRTTSTAVADETPALLITGQVTLRRIGTGSPPFISITPQVSDAALELLGDDAARLGVAREAALHALVHAAAANPGGEAVAHLGGGSTLRIRLRPSAEAGPDRGHLDVEITYEKSATNDTTLMRRLRTRLRPSAKSVSVHGGMTRGPITTHQPTDTSQQRDQTPELSRLVSTALRQGGWKLLAGWQKERARRGGTERGDGVSGDGGPDGVSGSAAAVTEEERLASLLAELGPAFAWAAQPEAGVRSANATREVPVQEAPAGHRADGSAGVGRVPGWGPVVAGELVGRGLCWTVADKLLRATDVDPRRPGRRGLPRSIGVVSEEVLTAGPGGLSANSRDGWPAVHSWAELESQLRDAGPGSRAVMAFSRFNGVGHVITASYTGTDVVYREYVYDRAAGTVQGIDLPLSQASPRELTGELTRVWQNRPAAGHTLRLDVPLDGHALVIRPDGTQHIPDQPADKLSRRVDALLDPTNPHRYTAPTVTGERPTDRSGATIIDIVLDAGAGAGSSVAPGPRIADIVAGARTAHAAGSAPSARPHEPWLHQPVDVEAAWQQAVVEADRLAVRARAAVSELTARAARLEDEALGLMAVHVQREGQGWAAAETAREKAARAAQALASAERQASERRHEAIEVRVARACGGPARPRSFGQWLGAAARAMSVVSDLSRHDDKVFLRLVREPYVFGEHTEAGELGSLAAKLVRQLQRVQQLMSAPAPASATPEQQRAYAAMNQWGSALAKQAVQAASVFEADPPRSYLASVGTVTGAVLSAGLPIVVPIMQNRVADQATFNWVASVSGGYLKILQRSVGMELDPRATARLRTEYQREIQGTWYAPTIPYGILALSQIRSWYDLGEQAYFALPVAAAEALVYTAVGYPAQTMSLLRNAGAVAAGLITRLRGVPILAPGMTNYRDLQRGILELPLAAAEQLQSAMRQSGETVEELKDFLDTFEAAQRKISPTLAALLNHVFTDVANLQTMAAQLQPGRWVSPPRAAVNPDWALKWGLVPVHAGLHVLGAAGESFGKKIALIDFSVYGAFVVTKAALIARDTNKTKHAAVQFFGDFSVSDIANSPIASYSISQRGKVWVAQPRAGLLVGARMLLVLTYAEPLGLLLTDSIAWAATKYISSTPVQTDPADVRPPPVTDAAPPVTDAAPPVTEEERLASLLAKLGPAFAWAAQAGHYYATAPTRSAASRPTVSGKHHAPEPSAGEPSAPLSKAVAPEYFGAALLDTPAHRKSDEPRWSAGEVSGVARDLFARRGELVEGSAGSGMGLGSSLEVCLALAVRLREWLFPAGVVAGVSRDDGALGTRRGLVFAGSFGGQGWSSVGSWRALAQAVADARGFAQVHVQRPGWDRHVLALVWTNDGLVRVDFGADGVQVEAAEELLLDEPDFRDTRYPSLVGARALILTPVSVPGPAGAGGVGGRPVLLPGAGAGGSTALALGMADPDTGRYGMPRPRRAPSSTGGVDPGGAALRDAQPIFVLRHGVWQRVEQGGHWPWLGSRNDGEAAISVCAGIVVVEIAGVWSDRQALAADLIRSQLLRVRSRDSGDGLVVLAATFREADRDAFLGWVGEVGQSDLPISPCLHANTLHLVLVSDGCGQPLVRESGVYHLLTADMTEKLAERVGHALAQRQSSIDDPVTVSIVSPSDVQAGPALAEPVNAALAEHLSAALGGRAVRFAGDRLARAETLYLQRNAQGEVTARARGPRVMVPPRGPVWVEMVAPGMVRLLGGFSGGRDTQVAPQVVADYIQQFDGDPQRPVLLHDGLYGVHGPHVWVQQLADCLNRSVFVLPPSPDTCLDMWSQSEGTPMLLHTQGEPASFLEVKPRGGQPSGWRTSVVGSLHGPGEFVFWNGHSVVLVPPGHRLEDVARSVFHQSEAGSGGQFYLVVDLGADGTPEGLDPVQAVELIAGAREGPTWASLHSGEQSRIELEVRLIVPVPGDPEGRVRLEKWARDVRVKLSARLSLIVTVQALVPEARVISRGGQLRAVWDGDESVPREPTYRLPRWVALGYDQQDHPATRWPSWDHHASFAIGPVGGCDDTSASRTVAVVLPGVWRPEAAGAADEQILAHLAAQRSNMDGSGTLFVWPLATFRAADLEQFQAWVNGLAAGFGPGVELAQNAIEVPSGRLYVPLPLLDGSPAVLDEGRLVAVDGPRAEALAAVIGELAAARARDIGDVVVELVCSALESSALAVHLAALMRRDVIDGLGVRHVRMRPFVLANGEQIVPPPLRPAPAGRLPDGMRRADGVAPVQLVVPVQDGVPFVEVLGGAVLSRAVLTAEDAAKFLAGRTGPGVPVVVFPHDVDGRIVPADDRLRAWAEQAADYAHRPVLLPQDLAGRELAELWSVRLEIYLLLGRGGFDCYPKPKEPNSEPQWVAHAAGYAVPAGHKYVAARLPCGLVSLPPDHGLVPWVREWMRSDRVGDRTELFLVVGATGVPQWWNEHAGRWVPVPVPALVEQIVTLHSERVAQRTISAEVRLWDGPGAADAAGLVRFAAWSGDLYRQLAELFGTAAVGYPEPGAVTTSEGDADLEWQPGVDPGNGRPPEIATIGDGRTRRFKLLVSDTGDQVISAGTSDPESVRWAGHLYTTDLQTLERLVPEYSVGSAPGVMLVHVVIDPDGDVYAPDIDPPEDRDQPPVVYRADPRTVAGWVQAAWPVDGKAVQISGVFIGTPTGSIGAGIPGPGNEVAAPSRKSAWARLRRWALVLSAELDVPVFLPPPGARVEANGPAGPTDLVSTTVDGRPAAWIAVAKDRLLLAFAERAFYTDKRGVLAAWAHHPIRQFRDANTPVGAGVAVADIFAEPLPDGTGVLLVPPGAASAGPEAADLGEPVPGGLRVLVDGGEQDPGVFVGWVGSRMLADPDSEMASGDDMRMAESLEQFAAQASDERLRAAIERRTKLVLEMLNEGEGIDTAAFLKRLREIDGLTAALIRREQSGQLLPERVVLDGTLLRQVVAQPRLKLAADRPWSYVSPPHPWAARCPAPALHDDGPAPAPEPPVPPALVAPKGTVVIAWSVIESSVRIGQGPPGDLRDPNDLLELSASGRRWAAYLSRAHQDKLRVEQVEVRLDVAPRARAAGVRAWLVAAQAALGVPVSASGPAAVGTRIDTDSAAATLPADTHDPWPWGWGASGVWSRKPARRGKTIFVGALSGLEYEVPVEWRDRRPLTGIVPVPPAALASLRTQLTGDIQAATGRTAEQVARTTGTHPDNPGWGPVHEQAWQLVETYITKNPDEPLPTYPAPLPPVPDPLPPLYDKGPKLPTPPDAYPTPPQLDTARDQLRTLLPWIIDAAIIHGLPEAHLLARQLADLARTRASAEVGADLGGVVRAVPRRGWWRKGGHLFGHDGVGLMIVRAVDGGWQVRVLDPPAVEREAEWGRWALVVAPGGGWVMAAADGGRKELGVPSVDSAARLLVAGPDAMPQREVGALQVLWQVVRAELASLDVLLSAVQDTVFGAGLMAQAEAVWAEFAEASRLIAGGEVLGGGGWGLLMELRRQVAGLRKQFVIRPVGSGRRFVVLPQWGWRSSPEGRLQHDGVEVQIVPHPDRRRGQFVLTDLGAGKGRVRPGDERLPDLQVARVAGSVGKALVRVPPPAGRVPSIAVDRQADPVRWLVQRLAELLPPDRLISAADPVVQQHAEKVGSAGTEAQAVALLHDAAAVVAARPRGPGGADLAQHGGSEAAGSLVAGPVGGGDRHVVAELAGLGLAMVPAPDDRVGDGLFWAVVLTAFRAAPRSFEGLLPTASWWSGLSAGVALGFLDPVVLDPGPGDLDADLWTLRQLLSDLFKADPVRWLPVLAWLSEQDRAQAVLEVAVSLSTPGGWLAGFDELVLLLLATLLQVRLTVLDPILGPRVFRPPGGAGVVGDAADADGLVVVRISSPTGPGQGRYFATVASVVPVEPVEPVVPVVPVEPAGGGVLPTAGVLRRREEDAAVAPARTRSRRRVRFAGPTSVPVEPVVGGEVVAGGAGSTDRLPVPGRRALGDGGDDGDGDRRVRPRVVDTGQLQPAQTPTKKQRSGPKLRRFEQENKQALDKAVAATQALANATHGTVEFAGAAAELREILEGLEKKASSDDVNRELFRKLVAAVQDYLKHGPRTIPKSHEETLPDGGDPVKLGSWLRKVVSGGAPPGPASARGGSVSGGSVWGGRRRSVSGSGGAGLGAAGSEGFGVGPSRPASPVGSRLGWPPVDPSSAAGLRPAEDPGVVLEPLSLMEQQLLRARGGDFVEAVRQVRGMLLNRWLNREDIAFVLELASPELARFDVGDVLAAGEWLGWFEPFAGGVEVKWTLTEAGVAAEQGVAAGGPGAVNPLAAGSESVSGVGLGPGGVDALLGPGVPPAPPSRPGAPVVGGDRTLVGELARRDLTMLPAADGVAVGDRLLSAVLVTAFRAAPQRLEGLLPTASWWTSATVALGMRQRDAELWTLRQLLSDLFKADPVRWLPHLAWLSEQDRAQAVLEVAVSLGTPGGWFAGFDELVLVLVATLLQVRLTLLDPDLGPRVFPPSGDAGVAGAAPDARELVVVRISAPAGAGAGRYFATIAAEPVAPPQPMLPDAPPLVPWGGATAPSSDPGDVLAGPPTSAWSGLPGGDLALGDETHTSSDPGDVLGRSTWDGRVPSLPDAVTPAWPLAGAPLSGDAPSRSPSEQSESGQGRWGVSDVPSAPVAAVGGRRLPIDAAKDEEKVLQALAAEKSKREGLGQRAAGLTREEIAAGAVLRMQSTNLVVKKLRKDGLIAPETRRGVERFVLTEKKGVSAAAKVVTDYGAWEELTEQRLEELCGEHVVTWVQLVWDVLRKVPAGLVQAEILRRYRQPDVETAGARRLTRDQLRNVLPYGMGMGRFAPGGFRGRWRVANVPGSEGVAAGPAVPGMPNLPATRRDRLLRAMWGQGPLTVVQCAGRAIVTYSSARYLLIQWTTSGWVEPVDNGTRFQLKDGLDEAADVVEVFEEWRPPTELELELLLTEQQLGEVQQLRDQLEKLEIVWRSRPQIAKCCGMSSTAVHDALTFGSGPGWFEQEEEARGWWRLVERGRASGGTGVGVGSGSARVGATSGGTPALPELLPAPVVPGPAGGSPWVGSVSGSDAAKSDWVRGVLVGRGLATLVVEPDGDCLFRAAAASALAGRRGHEELPSGWLLQAVAAQSPESLGRQGLLNNDVAWLRRQVARRFLAGRDWWLPLAWPSFQRPGGLPALARASDEVREQVERLQRAWPGGLPALTHASAELREQVAAVAAAWFSTPGAWADGLGDLVPGLLAAVLRVAVTVLDESSGTTQTFAPDPDGGVGDGDDPAADGLVVVRTDRGGGHYFATAPTSTVPPGQSHNDGGYGRGSVRSPERLAFDDHHRE
jgi:hypothetical protein